VASDGLVPHRGDPLGHIEAHAHVVLLDLSMPGLDGIDVAARFRVQDWGVDTKIIAITGLRRADDMKLAESVGIDFYLLKPANLKELHALLEKF